MQTIKVVDSAGTFAENKDIARIIRIKKIMPSLKNGSEIVLDFDLVTGATQSFVHALISDAMRKYGIESLDLIIFRNCSPIVREIVTTVTEYMQER